MRGITPTRIDNTNANLKGPFRIFLCSFPARHYVPGVPVRLDGMAGSFTFTFQGRPEPSKYQLFSEEVFQDAFRLGLSGGLP